MKQRHKEKWFHTEQEDTGWSKDLPDNVRMHRMVEAHRGDKLAAGRALLALANVTRDSQTERAARADAYHLFKEHQTETRHSYTPNKGIPIISPRVGRLS